VNFRGRGFRSRRDQGGLDMTPLIDVVFLLLIFFLITSNYVQTRRPAIPIEVPSARTGEGQSELRTAVVHIGRGGELFLDERPLESFDALAEGLRAMAQRAPAAMLLIRCDQDAPFGLSVRVMDLARQAGLQRFGVVTQPAP